MKVLQSASLQRIPRAALMPREIRKQQIAAVPAIAHVAVGSSSWLAHISKNRSA